MFAWLCVMRATRTYFNVWPDRQLALVHLAGDLRASKYFSCTNHSAVTSIAVPGEVCGSATPFLYSAPLRSKQEVGWNRRSRNYRSLLLGRIVASLDRKRLGQDRWQGRKTGSEAFSIRRLGGRRWRGGRGPMGFECAPGVRLRDGRAGWKCESWLVIMGRAANGWNGKLEKGQSRQGRDTRASACWRTSKRRYRRSC